jgi:hypothetical protein
MFAIYNIILTVVMSDFVSLILGFIFQSQLYLFFHYYAFGVLISLPMRLYLLTVVCCSFLAIRSFFVLSFVVVFVCLATHGGSPNKGINKAIKVQKRKGEVLK